MATPLQRARLPDWPERLAAYIEQRRHVPFAWGDNDCASFAAGAVAAMTGLTVAEVLPEGWLWRDEAEARLRLLDLHGVRRACQRLLGKPVTGPAAAMAARGAVVCVRIGGLNTLGVAGGNLRWCAPGEQGLVWRPMAEVKLAWEL